MAYEATSVILIMAACYCCYECLSICFSLGWTDRYRSYCTLHNC